MILETEKQAGVRSQWENAKLSDLIEDILENHHTPTKKRLSELKEFVSAAVKESANGEQNVTTLDSAVRGFLMTMKMHAEKEENILFPMIIKLEEGNTDAAEFCGGVANPIEVMERDHKEIDSHIERLKRWVEKHKNDADVEKMCAIVSTLINQIEADLKIHMFKEDYILFPRSKAI